MVFGDSLTRHTLKSKVLLGGAGVLAGIGL
jgi:hypothetical protein